MAKIIDLVSQRIPKVRHIQQIRIQYLEQVDKTYPLLNIPGQAHGRTVGGYSVTDTVAPETTKQYTSNVSYTGIAEGELKPMSYSDIYNATLNEIKEEISKGRAPTQTSIKQGTNTTHIGMVEEKESLEQRSSMNVTPLQNNMYGSESITMTTDKCQYDTNSRLENTDLEAYKTNPYTQPLNSSA